MHYYTALRHKVALYALEVEEGPLAARGGRTFSVAGTEESARYVGLVNAAARSAFAMTSPPTKPAPAHPTAFVDESNRLRVLYKEIVLRLKPRTPVGMRTKILARHALEIVSRNAFARDQYVLRDARGLRFGAELVDVANQLAELEETVFAAPNFVSEYRRAVPPWHAEQWHLKNPGGGGAVAGADARVTEAWAVTRGKPSLLVAVLDDGVDIEHPNLKGRVVKHPDPEDPHDVCGRDFFVADDVPDTYDPRPKLFRYPYQNMTGNDIHGTPCAGVALANGKKRAVRGAAPGCRLLPVKIFHADEIAQDARVADAIRYAARIADVLSCSWSGPVSPDLELAIEDAAAGRDGKGVAVFCAAGNEYGDPVGYPAAHPQAIAIGASTDRDELADYSNVGPELSIVAPSSGGRRGIFTTDVSYANRGFNVGREDAGGADGLFTNDFGGTSSATPLAAGVAALLLSVHPDLTRTEVKQILEQTADKIGRPVDYDARGHSDRYGYGRLNARRAVEEAKRRRPKPPAGPKPKAPSRKGTAARRKK